ncbi:hypothetical protein Bca52824_089726 [Brassica carinata]|uniref:DNA topoisomerase I n=1 Tax=Brassica carinata TaxID=52824 RepID=A0A8X7PG92_BRACI|nr:hypothetical protein Bca52824_089726 [Brassica carinata]
MSGDSEDDTTLRSIISIATEQKINGNTTLDKPSRTSRDDESDDVEAPISSRLQKKKHVRESSGNDEKKLLVKKFQNGSKLESEKPKVSGKRLLEKDSSADQFSMKKHKASSSTAKQDSAKTENLDRKRKAVVSPNETDDDDVPIAKRIKSDSSNSKTPSAKLKVTKQSSTSSSKKPEVTRAASPPPKKNSKRSKKKWTTLVHNGVTFPPPYEPHGTKILYKGKPVNLSPEQEEVATMFAVMRDTDYYNIPLFRKNFWNDWRKLLGKKHVIQKLDDCDFTPIYEWHLEKKQKNKDSKEKKQEQEEKYMWAIVDGVKEKIGNFKVEPPGLFAGRGEHPKMGKLKRRIHPHDITLNIGIDAPIPECPIPGERWKEVKHDNTVTWLAMWNDPINPKDCKYVFLSPSSSQKGHSDKKKYEKARKLKDHIESIRETYTKNFNSKDVSKRQIAVATYLIDKLALRAGNGKDEDEEADTVGCCTLKVDNVECIHPNQLKFDFLGKDSIRYENTVEVEPPGLFAGRGEHPKMGKFKRRIHPHDITLNIGIDAPIPECPIPGERWKEIRHDNTVSWLAMWNDPINPKDCKYVFLSPSSSQKGHSDKKKYEKARKLKDHIESIREAYTKNFTSKDVLKRQIAVATYLIDKLALRAGTDKDDDEADTVGCCTLKVDHVECIHPNQLKFDFLGKDSIRYENTVEVEPPVYKAIGQFKAGKSDSDDLFDEIDANKLNAHLKELMPGLTAKVFRTYNASITLDKTVAIICNHQRAVTDITTVSEETPNE